MTVEEEIELQKIVKAHQATLGRPEMKRRAHLVGQANVLINCLVARVMTFKYVDCEQTERSLRALDRANRRAERRERAYYGA